MIKDTVQLIGFLFKVIIKAMKFVMKGVKWYLLNISEIFKAYPKKSSDKIHIKEEIL